MKRLWANLLFWQLSLLTIWLGILLYVLSFWFFHIALASDFSLFLDFVKTTFKGSYILEDLEQNFLDEFHFQLVKEWIGLIIFFTILATTFLVYLLVNMAKSSFTYIPIKKIKFQKNELTLLFILFAVWLGYKIFLFNYLPIHIDEIFDFIFFSKTNLITCHTYIFSDGNAWYNNHVIYSDLCGLLHRLGLESTLSFRLPSILGELGLMIFLYLRYREESVLKALIVLFLIASSFWVGVYSIQARSYYLMGVCVVISYYLSIDFVKQPSKSNVFGILLLSIFGLALNKLFAIPLLANVIFLFLFDKNRNTKLLFKLGLTLFIFSILFYSPAILVSGFQSVFTSNASQKIYDLSLYPLLLETLSFITNIDSKSYLFLGLGAILLFTYRKKLSPKSIALITFFSSQLISLAVFTLLIKSYFPSRTFVYLNILFCLLLASILFDFIQFHKRKKLISVVISTILVLNTSYNFKYSWAKKYDNYVLGFEFYNQMKTTLDKMLQEKPKSVFIPRDEYFFSFYCMYFSDPSVNVIWNKKHHFADFIISRGKQKIENYSLFDTILEQDLYIYKSNEN